MSPSYMQRRDEIHVSDGSMLMTRDVRPLLLLDVERLARCRTYIFLSFADPKQLQLSEYEGV